MNDDKCTFHTIGYTFTVDRGNATITRYTGDSGAVTVPDTMVYGRIGGLPVTAIGEQAFSGCTSVYHRRRSKKLTSITLPDSITTIGKWAFYGCIGLTSITLPNSVTTIEDNAFRDCIGLTSVTLSTCAAQADPFLSVRNAMGIPLRYSLTTIGYGAFNGCIGLTSINLFQDSLTTIEAYAFEGCTALTSITLPNSLTSIGNSAFEGCTALTSITLPNGAKIDASAFFGCTRLINPRGGRRS